MVSITHHGNGWILMQQIHLHRREILETKKLMKPFTDLPQMIETCYLNQDQEPMLPIQLMESLTNLGSGQINPIDLLLNQSLLLSTTTTITTETWEINKLMKEFTDLPQTIEACYLNQDQELMFPIQLMESLTNLGNGQINLPHFPKRKTLEMLILMKLFMDLLPMTRMSCQCQEEELMLPIQLMESLIHHGNGQIDLILMRQLLSQVLPHFLKRKTLEMQTLMKKFMDSLLLTEVYYQCQEEELRLLTQLMVSRMPHGNGQISQKSPQKLQQKLHKVLFKRWTSETQSMSDQMYSNLLMMSLDRPHNGEYKMDQRPNLNHLNPDKELRLCLMDHKQQSQPLQYQLPHQPQNLQLLLSDEAFGNKMLL